MLGDAAGNGSTAECEALIEEGADPNFEDPREWLGTPLHRAAKHGHAETCCRLLNMGMIRLARGVGDSAEEFPLFFKLDSI